MLLLLLSHSRLIVDSIAVGVGMMMMVFYLYLYWGCVDLPYNSTPNW
jgi:hypothetical protein